MATTTQRLTALETSVSALRARLTAAEARLAALEAPPAAPTPAPAPAPAAALHGRDITLDNTGPAAAGYALTDVTTPALASQAPGGVWTGKRFTRGITIDAPVTLVGCEIVGTIDTHGHITRLEWCSIAPATPGDWALGPENFSAYRTRLAGCSDGARANGGTKGSSLVECHIRCASQSAQDHNDGIQNYGGSGAVVVLRCNISVAGLPGANAALFSADGATGSTSWVDNLIAGGGYALRAYEDTSYVIRGNEIVDGSWGFGPVAMFNPNGREFTAEDNWIVDSAGRRTRPVVL